MLVWGRRWVWYSAVVLLVVLIAAPCALAQGYAKQGFYLGLYVPYNSVSDEDFDGTSYLTDEEADVLVLVPEVDSALGLGIALGYRFSKASVEINYLWSNHDAEWSHNGLIATGDEAELSIFNLDGRYYFNTADAVQPFLYGGINITTLTAKDFAADASGPDDAEYHGAGINFGGGVAFYITPQFALNGTLYYRYVTMTSLDAAGESGSLDDDMDASSVNLMVGASFTF
jgi:outer membrane protein W